MIPPTIEFVCTESPELRREIAKQLIAFNESQLGPENSSDVLIIARGSNREIFGGLLGYTQRHWLFVSHLWVKERLRGMGIGSRLLKAAEDLALERQCDRVHLDTYDFQALDFYRTRGYTIFGQLENYPIGHTRYFLHKRLAADSEDSQRIAK